MTIKCGNCGHENLLGAIFCRNCGEKLDVETIRPEIKGSGSEGGGLFGLIRRLVGLVVLFGLIGVMVAMFMPAKLENAVLSDDAKATADKKFDAVMQKINTGLGSDNYTFSPEEITYIYNSKFISAPSEIEGQSAYAIESLNFSLDPVGYLHFIIKSKLGGKVPTTFDVKGIASTDDSGTISFNIIETKMGHMPIKFLESKVIEKFDPVINDSKVERILRSIGKIEVTDDRQISISVREVQDENEK